MAITGRDEDDHECEVQALQRQFCPMLSWAGCTGARADGMPLVQVDQKAFLREERPQGLGNR